MRVLVAGWFSLQEGGATAGDLLVRDVVCAWLGERAIPHDVAQPAQLGPGVDWLRTAPESYTHVVVACGPVGPALEVARIPERFAGCRCIAVDVSLVDEGSARLFDVVIARDGGDHDRPDVALAAPASPAVPVVGRIEVHEQAEYADARPHDVHAAFDRALLRHSAAVVRIDTRLDERVPGRRSPAEVDALLARVDLVLTTRLHGLVLSVRRGVPAVVVDPVVGGAKVLAQARTLGWPAVTTVDELSDEWLDAGVAWARTPEARARVAASAAAARHGLDEVRRMLDEALTASPQSGTGARRRGAGRARRPAR